MYNAREGVCGHFCRHLPSNFEENAEKKLKEEGWCTTGHAGQWISAGNESAFVNLTKTQ